MRDVIAFHLTCCRTSPHSLKPNFSVSNRFKETVFYDGAGYKLKITEFKALLRNCTWLVGHQYGSKLNHRCDSFAVLECSESIIDFMQGVSRRGQLIEVQITVDVGLSDFWKILFRVGPLQTLNT